jgi:putative membrane protein
MNLILKGFIIGIGKIMPGVSGSMLAIALNEYEKIIESIATIKKDSYKKIKYLSKISLGIIIAIIITSKIIVKLINYHYLSTILLFIGIIAGNILETIKKIKYNKKDIIMSIIILIVILLIISIEIKNKNINKIIDKESTIFIELIIVGMIDALSSIIPGISGTVILINLGYYNTIITMFSTITSLELIIKNISVAVPFFIGFTTGIILISKIINKIIKNKENIIKILTTLFMIYTCTSIISNAFKQVISIKEIIVGITLFVTSFTLSIIISNKSKKNIYI